MPYKIMIGINTLNAIEQPVYSNHLQFFFRLGRNTDHHFAINTPRRMSIDRMRNVTAKLALENEFDYVLFVDDDVTIPINSLQMLLKMDADIAAGWTIIRGHPYKNMFFHYKEPGVLEHYPTDPEWKDTIVDCDAVGFSCALIKCSLLKKVSQPYFVTGPHNTEDVYFCVKAAQEVGATIKVHTGIKTYHNVGPEFVGPDNVDRFKQYMEEAWPELTIDENRPADRGDDYLASLDIK